MIDGFIQLAEVFGKLREKEAEHMAHIAMHRMKLGAEREKRLSIKQSQKTLKRYNSSPRRAKTRTVSCSNVHRLPEPKRRPERKHKPSLRSRFSWHSSPPPPSPLPDPDPSVEGPNTLYGSSEATGDAEVLWPLREQLVAENTTPQPLHHFPHVVSLHQIDHCNHTSLFHL